MTQRHKTQNNALMLITTNTDGKLVFRDDACAREAIECLYRVQKLYPFKLCGFVIMPDHCHFLIYVPKPGSISKIMNSYKSGLTFDLGIPKIWQARFHIRIVEDGKAALEYIHMNPVKAKIVDRPKDYPWSSACGKWEITPLEEAHALTLHS